MKTEKILLSGMLATMMFAACTNEDIVPQKMEQAPEVDLSNRPVVGVVDLDFGPQTRADLADGSFNHITRKPGDKMGARIIDEVKSNGECQLHTESGYTVSKYAWSNYRYDYNDATGKWNSDALMVEGNYMFYAPYNEKALHRNALEIDFPVEQSVKTLKAVPESEACILNAEAVENFVESNLYTYEVGHVFVDASDPDAGVSVSPRLTQLYAYPQITLVNDYTETEEKQSTDKKGNLLYDEDGDPVMEPVVVGKDLKIDEIKIYASNKFFAKATIDHEALVGALRLDLEPAFIDKNNNGRRDYGEYCNGHTFENWTEPDKANDGKTTWFLENARTSNIVTVEKYVNCITVTLQQPVTIKPGYKVSLNVVLPAEDYSSTDLGVNVRVLKENKKGEEVAWQFKDKKNFAYIGDEVDVDGLHYAVGKRYAEQEYNYPADGLPAPKNSAGALATYRLSGELEEYDPEEVVYETEGIHNIGEMTDWLEAVTDNSTDAVEKGGEHVNSFVMATDNEMTLSDTLVKAVKTYMKNSTVTYTSQLVVVGSNDPKNPLVISKEQFGGFGNLVIKSGYVRFEGLKVGTVAYLNGNYTAKADFINCELNIADLRGQGWTAGCVIKGDLSGSTISGNPAFDGGSLNNATVKGTVTFRADASVTGLSATKAVVTNGAEVDVEGGFATEVVVENGTLNVNSEESGIENVTLGKEGANVNANGTSGHLKINADLGEGVTIEGISHKNVANTITVAEGVTANLADLTWGNLTVTNNGTISSGLTVPADQTYTHGANATVEGTLTNNGTVYNNGKVALENNCLVVPGEGGFTKTDVTGGTGRIDNTNLGYVTGTVTNQIIYIEKVSFDNDDAWANLETTNSKVNTIRVTGTWTVGRNVEAGAYNYELAGSVVNIGAATLDFSKAESVKILADQTWKGLDADVSKVTGAEITFGSSEVDDVEVYYTLNVADIDMGEAYADALAKAVAAGGKVTLGADVEMSGHLTVESGKTLDLNLNGHKLLATESHAIVNNGTLILTNGSIETMANSARGLRNYGTATVNCNIIGNFSNCIEHSGNGTLTINGGKYETKLTDGSAVRMDTRDANDKAIDAAWNLVINGGTFVSPWAAIYMANNYWDLNPEGSAVIRNATITGGTKADIVVNTCENIEIYKSCTLNSTDKKIYVEGDMKNCHSVINGVEVTEEGYPTVTLKD